MDKKCKARFTSYEYIVGDPDLDRLTEVDSVLKTIEQQAREAQDKVRDIVRGG